MTDWNTELNRLAGTTGKDDATAASTYAGLTTTVDVVQALNYKLSPTTAHYWDLPDVLRRLAGTAPGSDIMTSLAAIGAAAAHVSSYLMENSSYYLLEDGSSTYLLE